jgi:hypothetical protein
MPDEAPDPAPSHSGASEVYKFDRLDPAPADLVGDLWSARTVPARPRHEGPCERAWLGEPEA